MYDNNVVDEQCAVVSRIAPNFFRFGSFEIFKQSTDAMERSGPSAGNNALKAQLLDHVMLYFPEITQRHSRKEDQYAAYFEEIVKLTAELVARWQAVGFVHGVLNTDHRLRPLRLHGAARRGLRAERVGHWRPLPYSKQPAICKWNLYKLSEALDPVLPTKVSQEILERQYDAHYDAEYWRLMGAKFGLVPRSETSKALIAEFFTVMSETATDFTDAFVALTEFREDFLRQVQGGAGCSAVDGADWSKAVESLTDRLVSRSSTTKECVDALSRKLRIHRLSMHPSQIMGLWTALQQSPEQVAKMFSGAPVEAIREEIAGEKRKLDMLMKATKDTQKYEAMEAAAVKKGMDRTHWRDWCAQYKDLVIADFRGALQADPLELWRQQVKLMRQSNPTFIWRSSQTRNWIAQEVIAQEVIADAEKGDYSGVNIVLKMLMDPFNPKFSTFRAPEMATCRMAEPKKSYETDGEKAGEEDGEDEVTATQLRFIAVSKPAYANSLICTCSS